MRECILDMCAIWEISVYTLTKANPTISPNLNIDDNPQGMGGRRARMRTREF